MITLASVWSYLRQRGILRQCLLMTRTCPLSSICKYIETRIGGDRYFDVDTQHGKLWNHINCVKFLLTPHQTQSCGEGIIRIPEFTRCPIMIPAIVIFWIVSIIMDVHFKFVLVTKHLAEAWLGSRISHGVHLHMENGTRCDSSVIISIIFGLFQLNIHNSWSIHHFFRWY